MSTNWQQQLSVWGELHCDVPLAKHTTLGVGGAARWLFKPEHREALQAALAVIPDDIAIMPLGRGSNLLVPDCGFDGVVLDLGTLNGVEMQGCRLIAGAGCRMSKVAQLAATHACRGLEFMATVPGDIGGGVAMNAGAFGQQVSDVLQEVELLCRDGSMVRIPAEDLTMSYRSTALPERSVVVSAAFVLVPDDAEKVRERMREMRSRRSQTQPLALPNCGSVFKNPQGDYAARLIEAAGMKGVQVGGAQVSEVHANFIVNHGQATASDVLDLIRKVQDKVQETSGIRLEPEVRILQAFGEVT